MSIYGDEIPPPELVLAVEAFWPPEQVDNALSVAYLESHWDAFAVLDSRDPQHPCGSVIGERGGVKITAEYSIGYFQLNACNFPTWPAERFFNAWHNAGTAHMLWDSRGWSPWYFSAQRLGLV